MGRFQSGQMGRTVNPLLRLRRFDPYPAHHIFYVESPDGGMVDTPVLEAGAARREGSSPSLGTSSI